MASSAWQIGNRVLWGLRRRLWNGSSLAAPLGHHVRSVYVEVKDDNFELALNKYGRLMRQDKTLNELSKRQFALKPSELKVLARKERDRRIAKREFKEKLKWIMSRRSRWVFEVLAVHTKKLKDVIHFLKRGILEWIFMGSKPVVRVLHNHSHVVVISLVCYNGK
ncbi:hypothetical protein O6H91_08G045000 [Diphasiastrum complanatum]|uniref:Uncharacterized protein n=1 Tax=Diphasiastrum complanatum TaxID=34168 RepID=A0ACC2CWZ8_DIPCM|nr:hypothetical protein O6H91_08G045000 [Diphasiastrum complanatum]